jgi:hypothetical protein
MLIAALVVLAITLGFWLAGMAYIKKANGINECTASYNAALWTLIAYFFGFADIVLWLVYAAMHIKFQ